MTEFHLATVLFAQIKVHIASDPGHEVCGLVGGMWRPFPKKAIAHQVVTIPNTAPDADVRYRMNPAAQIKAMMGFEAQGWETVGIYHSHPRSKPIPSLTDIAEASYPDAVHLIGVPDGDLRAWRIVRGAAYAVEMVIME